MVRKSFITETLVKSKSFKLRYYLSISFLLIYMNKANSNWLDKLNNSIYG